MEAWKVEEKAGACIFSVYVTPGSRSDAVAGLYGDALRIRLQAPPVHGRANEALRTFLAKRLGVPVAAVTVLAGHTSRRKVVRVTGVTAAQVRALAEGGGKAAGQ